MFRVNLRALACLVAAAMVSTVAAAEDLTVALSGAVTSMDPQFHVLSPNNAVARHLFDRLVDTDEHQRPRPGLATEWKAIDDTTWEFKLRQGVKFHDGSDFTAEDVVATLKRVPWVPNSPSSFRIYTQAIVSTEILDPYTIRFKTASPYPLLPIDLSAVHIISRKFEQAPTGDFNSGRAAIGTGPFKFVEYVPGDRIVLVRNDSYWGPKPDWQRVTLKQISNNSARVAALLAGDVQIIEQVPSTDYAKLRTTPDVAVSEIVGNRLIYLHLDSFRDQTPFVTDKTGAVLPNNPLKDVRVRRALSKAINRQAIVDRIMEGIAIPAGGLMAEGFFGVSPKLKPDPFDPEGARKLLTEAGYPNGFGMTIHGPNDRYLNDEKILQAIGPMFNRVGIDTKVVTQPWATFASASSAPNYAYSVMLVGWGADTGEVSSPLRSLLATPSKDKGWGGSNRGRYSNPKMDALLSQALETVDDQKRDKLLQQASEVAIADVGLIPLHYQINVWATRKGYTYAPRADEYTLAHSVHPAK
ncbi:MAG TPA: ABC transporter substrate-binding protein [Alphaproteobacteria bacterium]